MGLPLSIHRLFQWEVFHSRLLEEVKGASPANGGGETHLPSTSKAGTLEPLLRGSL